jgi:hypothetical protein
VHSSKSSASPADKQESDRHDWTGPAHSGALQRREPYEAKVSRTVLRGEGGRKAILLPDWIKQNLRIKHFFGNSDNAVKTQVWIVVCVYVLVAIVRKELGLELSLSQILQVLSVHVFEQVPLIELLAKIKSQNETLDSRNQLVFNMF